MYISLKRDPHEERYPVRDSTRVHVYGETREVVLNSLKFEIQGMGESTLGMM